MSTEHDAAVEAACRAMLPTYNPSGGDEIVGDIRRAIAAFLRAWRPSDEAMESAGCADHKLQYAARATADELDPP